MNDLEFLQNRASIPAKYLTDPAPDDSQLKDILTAGLAAPDHAALRPWRFIVIQGDAREKLGDLFVRAGLDDDPEIPADKQDRIRDKPMRSPLIITVVAKITPDHPKTPPVEQILSAGAAAQQILLAANALGFGSVWLTGPNTQYPMVKSGLGVEDKDEIIGFIYIGTSSIKPPKPARPALDDHLSIWQG